MTVTRDHPGRPGPPDRPDRPGGAGRSPAAPREPGQGTVPAGSGPRIPLGALVPEQGAAVLLPDGTAAAVFVLHDGSVHAVGNIDPFYGAPVICHGIVGDRGGLPTVASPLGKQAFCLRTGRCLDDPRAALPVFRAVVRDGVIHLSAPGNTGETPART